MTSNLSWIDAGIVGINYFPAPDWDFRCFYPCKIFLSHTPVPALGKDKKNEQPHAGRTSIRDVIVMLKWRHHVASQRIQDYLEVFIMFFSNIKIRYLVVSKKKNPLFVRGWDRKICHSRSFVIARQASWCQSATLGTDFSIPPTLMMDTYIVEPLCGCLNLKIS